MNLFVVWQDNRDLSVYTKAGLSGWLFWGQISEIYSQITVTAPKIFIWLFFGPFPGYTGPFQKLDMTTLDPV